MEDKIQNKTTDNKINIGTTDYISVMDIKRYADDKLRLFEYLLNEMFCIRNFLHTTQTPDFNYTLFSSLKDWKFDNNLMPDEIPSQNEEKKYYYFINDEVNTITINPDKFEQITGKSINLLKSYLIHYYGYREIKEEAETKMENYIFRNYPNSNINEKEKYLLFQEEYDTIVRDEYGGKLKYGDKIKIYKKIAIKFNTNERNVASSISFGKNEGKKTSLI